MSLIFIPPVSRRTDCPLGGTTPTSYLLAIFLSSEIFANFPRRFNYCIKSATNTRYSIYKKAHAPPCIGACARPHACRGSGHALPRRAAPILSARVMARTIFLYPSCLSTCPRRLSAGGGALRAPFAETMRSPSRVPRKRSRAPPSRRPDTFLPLIRSVLRYDAPLFRAEAQQAPTG